MVNTVPLVTCSEWAGEASDPKERVIEAQLATLIDREHVGDGLWDEDEVAEDRTPSISGRVTEDEDLGGVTGPDHGSSSSFESV